MEPPSSDVALFGGMNEPYIPFCAGPEHPSLVRHSQTSKLASPPAISEDDLNTLLAPELREGGIVSAVQLDAIALGRKAHLASRAFLVGDSTGLGKGRTGVGALWNGFLLDSADKVGRRAVYFSTAQVLETLQRDVSDFGIDVAVVDLRNSRSLPRDRDVILFVSYLSLTNKAKAGSEPHLEFIQRFVSEAPNANTVPLVIDEAHAVKNCHGTGASGSAKAALQLFTNLRDASRMTFMSATPASCIEHLRLYAPFVGFVGPGGAFSGFDRLVTKLGSNKDTSSLEFLSAELVATGSYVARTLAYDGVEFSEEIVPMTERWRAQHDAATRIFDALLATGLFEGKARRARFYNTSLRFFKSLLLTGKVDRTIEIARGRLAKGMQVVVSMSGTGEAAAARAIKKRKQAEGLDDDDPIDVVDAGVRDTLFGLLNDAVDNHNEDVQEYFDISEKEGDLDWRLESFDHRAELWRGKHVLVRRMLDPLAKFRCFEGAIGKVTDVCNEASVKVQFLHGLVRNRGIPECYMVGGETKMELRLRELAALRDLPSNEEFGNTVGFQLYALRREAVCIDLPDASALDLLKHGLGGRPAVAELTGRSDFVERDHRGEWVARKRDQGMLEERAAFQAGEKRAAVLSLAMSSGIDLHADSPDSARRCQILFELPWSAEKAMQQIGRVHRARQVSAPEYVLVSSDRGFEARFSATVGARLSQLGAISSGDRETLTTSSRLRLRGTDELDAEHFVSTRAKEAVSALFKDPAYRTLFERMGLRDLDSLTGKQFMNRAMALPCEDSDTMFRAFVDGVLDAIAYAEQHGSMSKPIEMLHVDGERVRRTTTLVSPSLGAEIHVFRVDAGLTFADADAKRREKLASGVPESKVFFAYMSNVPILVWHRTQRQFVQFLPLGQTRHTIVNYLPEPVAADATFQSAWKHVYDDGNHQEPRVVLKRVLMLPSLRTLAVLGPSKTTRLAKVTFADGQRTLGVDLGTESGSWISQATLHRHGFATAEEHRYREERAAAEAAAAAAAEAARIAAGPVHELPTMGVQAGAGAVAGAAPTPTPRPRPPPPPPRRRILPDSVRPWASAPRPPPPPPPRNTGSEVQLFTSRSAASGYHGVKKCGNGYTAVYGRTNHYIGHFPTAKEAAIAYAKYVRTPPTPAHAVALASARATARATAPPPAAPPAAPPVARSAYFSASTDAAPALPPIGSSHHGKRPADSEDSEAKRPRAEEKEKGGGGVGRDCV